MSIEFILKKVPFFAHLADAELAHVASLGKTWSLPADQIVFNEGDLSHTMYVVLSGQAKVFRRDEQGHEVVLLALTEGDYFGEFALLDDRPRSAAAVTLTACEFFVLDQQAFMSLLAPANTQMAQSVFAALVSRLRETSRKYVQDELAKQALQASMEIERHRSIAQLVAGVAHEVNTPLGIINTAASIVEHRLKTVQGLAHDEETRAAVADMREAAQLIQGNIARAHKLVEDFKKVSVSQIVDTKERMVLREAVAEIVGLFKATARQANLTIEVKDLLPEGSSEWLGYRGYLSQVILNLLTNVERYAYPQGNGGKVEVTLTASNYALPPRFTLRVRDFGVGIAPEHLPKVCEPFFTTGRDKGGTGLGMAMVYNLVTGPLQGQLEIASERGQGTLVTVAFPQKIPDETV
jgi:signal transduction histidine kinase